MDDDDDAVEDDPVLEHKTVKHVGGINRIRVSLAPLRLAYDRLQVMPHPEMHFAATWADTGKVHIWDLTEVVQSLDQPGMRVNPGAFVPQFSVSNHTTEGFALDWSPTAPGR
jgi:ribosome assembly protein RRB1